MSKQLSIEISIVLAKLKEGKILINLKKDYRIEFRGENRYAVSSPNKNFEKRFLNEEEILNFLS